MISPEGIKVLNRILPVIPIDKEFRISTLIDGLLDVDKSVAGELSWEISVFLTENDFAVRVGSATLLRKGITPDIRLEPKGIELKYAGTYDTYSNKESVRIITSEENQKDLEKKVVYLTGILAFGTMALALSEIVKIYCDYHCLFSLYSLSLLGIGIVILCLIFPVWKQITSKKKNVDNHK